ncbi:aspartyl/asparaginyl beta-hydroxylase domain-containing protein [Lysobacter solisilvae (ex Woo and Kim 2020)]|uniref:Aspartyl/asparaginyl beta-hydroxylase domain-containing protein n=1 Tax=Agrilutibacter terrestris TaxID=2865112 RepID=A0A7H0G0H4_9GAMM|nr:aspartyl/asparaginyl beta-hydroxylase domain-containing protein [Lysobacter terrestris]QNP41790.1 aspartyl/asparaginyl beta-hydroxylase domain-containing protein [Lysobacter terrestris]
MSELLARARGWAQAGDARAEAAYRQVLEQGESVEARVFLAHRALAQGAARDALAHLQLACRHEPGNAQLLYQLAMAAEAAGYRDEARAALQFAVQLAPSLHVAHLQLGRLLEAAGDRHDAARSYFRALTRAQLEEQWLDEASTPPRLRAQVAHAVAFVQATRPQILGALLEPLIARHGRDAMRRVERGLNGYLGVANVAPADPRQRPKFLFFPDLPETPFLRRADFDWIPRLEAAWADIRDEARAVLAEPQALTPFLAAPDDADLGEYLQGAAGAQPHWDAFFFYRHGRAYADNHQRSPATARALAALPLLRIADHAPEVCFSVLSPGTHILPHHGVTNIRTVVHLPLLVPRDCALRVGDEVHAWREGECVAFDDTWLHEAWNRSDATRVILLMDAWNPHLTEPERDAVATLIEGIGEFNRG